MDKIYKGVSFEKKVNKYRAYIDLIGTKIRLGYFSTQDEAKGAVDAARSKYFDDNGFLIFERDFVLPQLFTLYKDYLRRSSLQLKLNGVKPRSYKFYIISQNPKTTSPTPIPDVEGGLEEGVRLVLNGNSVKKAAKYIGATEYELKKELDRIVDVSIKSLGF